VVAMPYQRLEKVSKRWKEGTSRDLEDTYSLTTVTICSRELLRHLKNVWVVLDEMGFEELVELLCSNKE
jgi:hypothetical protein